MLHATINRVLEVKAGGFLVSAEVLFFAENASAYSKVIDFSLSPSLSDSLSDAENAAALSAEAEYTAQQ
jgi:hypothetical protein